MKNRVLNVGAMSAVVLGWPLSIAIGWAQVAPAPEQAVVRPSHASSDATPVEARPVVRTASVPSAESARGSVSALRSVMLRLRPAEAIRPARAEGVRQGPDQPLAGEEDRYQEILRTTVPLNAGFDRGMRRPVPTNRHDHVD